MTVTPTARHHSCSTPHQLSAEPVALIPQCEECSQIWLPGEIDRWRCYLADEDNLVFFCPDCAEREFDDD